MPSHEYLCPKCRGSYTLRRLFSELDDPIESLCCGQVLERQFAATANLFVPIHMQAVLTGGKALGGGSLSWSDFHDQSYEETMRDSTSIPANRMKSKPGI